MNALRFSRRALGIIAALAILAGCGGSQVAPTGGAPLSLAAATHGKSWMLPESTSEDLLYASGPCHGVCIFSYPTGTLVGSIDNFGAELCPDKSGDVFQPATVDYGQGIVNEYVHGGTTPIATLSVGKTEALSCSVDPTTGNLAVATYGFSTGVSIFPKASGSPVFYSADFDPLYLGYDNAGNLFLDGIRFSVPLLAELPHGGGTIADITIHKTIRRPGQVQWDGKYVTIEDMQQPVIYQLSIKGSRATVVGTTTFAGVGNRGAPSWIQGNTVVLPYGKHSLDPKDVGLWKYPGGGKGKQIAKNLKFDEINGTTVSLSPSR